jgi:2-dehydropantoate 2-reductase
VRFVVFGAGAVGGVVGGRLAEHGEDVVLIARGAHADAIEASGLTVESPDGTVVVDVPFVRSPAELTVDDGDVVLLGMKSQDTGAALAALRPVAPPSIPIVCLQNGVENERLALRLFERVYAICVMLPGVHLVPGVVQAYSSPVSGLLDIGRYPSGTDEVSAAVAAALGRSSFDSVDRPEIMRWKYAKLLMNLGNALEAACGPVGRAGELFGRVVEEGRACLAAAAIDVASADEDAERRSDLLSLRPVGGARRGGGSTWQSLQRNLGSVETDYLNGEIVLLGRRLGVPTPVNALLQHVAAELAAGGAAPGSIDPDELLRRLG